MAAPPFLETAPGPCSEAVFSFAGLKYAARQSLCEVWIAIMADERGAFWIAVRCPIRVMLFGPFSFDEATDLRNGLVRGTGTSDVSAVFIARDREQASQNASFFFP